MRARAFFLLIACSFFPLVSFASIQVSEVMYDVAGSDTGREWIEVTNTGDTAVDLSAYKVFEGGVNHKMTVVQGSATLPPHTAAVIADNPQKFLSDWTGFTGALFDSVFTSGLSNTGETLVIRRGDLTNEDTVTYSSAGGASGNGLSLARGSGGTFVATKPTPGVYEQNPAAAPIPAPKQISETAPQVQGLHTEAPTTQPTPSNKETAAVASGLIEEAQAENSSSGQNEGTPSYLVWMLGAVGLCIMGAGAVIALQMQGKQPSPERGNKLADLQKEAESYEIIES